MILNVHHHDCDNITVWQSDTNPATDVPLSIGFGNALYVEFERTSDAEQMGLNLLRHLGYDLPARPRTKRGT